MTPGKQLTMWLRATDTSLAAWASFNCLLGIAGGSEKLHFNTPQIT